MSRKRAAPGAEPAVPSNYQQIQSNQWSPAAMDQQNNYGGNQDFGVNAYQNAVPALQRETSNQLTRRAPGQMGLAQYNGGNGWPVQQQQQQQFQTQQPEASNDGTWQGSDDELDRKAEIAERTAIAKRKSIPPFVQKLRSFVDDDKNSELIRWSEDGDSFIVLDEDEFAKKLIPELFKHNKYPSFVRQLNMYGFHKRVALSDNSMRASERKSKSPSEYHNPFFRRGRPRLMWLIQKPKTGQTGKKNVNGEDIDDDEFEGDNAAGPAGRPRQSIMPTGGGQNVLSPEAQSRLHEELIAIRRNQAAIQEEVRKLREENDMMQNRAAAYQAIHQRHENSINAILTFLATVFRNQIEGRDTASLASLFPQAAAREPQQGDRVVDLADFEGRDSRAQTSTPRPQRKPLLLEAPAAGYLAGDDSRSRVESISTPTASEFSGRETSAVPPSSATDAPRQQQQKQQQSQQQQQQQQPIKTEPSAEPSPSEDILSFLNQQSAGAGGNVGRFDYPQALSQLQSANSRSPMSIPQRNDLLRLMANGQVGNVLNGSSNNALTSPSPPPIPGPSDPQWAARSKDIEELERSIREQDDRFNNVTQLLGPLSPSGSINFLDSDRNVQAPSDFDLDWLNTNNDPDNGENPFFDFKDFDANNNGVDVSEELDDADQSRLKPGGTGGGGGDGSYDSSQAASPAGTVNTLDESTHEQADLSNPPNKRQRVV